MPFNFEKPMFGFDALNNERKRPGAFGNPGKGLGVDLTKEHKGRDFYCGQSDEQQINTCLHQRTCFNHLTGLPISKTTGKTLPIFDYEMLLFNEMEGRPHDIQIPDLRTIDGTGNDNEVRYMAIKKSRGLGISEFFLRYMAWLGICHNEDFAGTMMFIVCGPGENIAVDLIKRMKQILQPLHVLEDAAYNICRFMGVEVYARPGAHVASLRGYENVKFILVDEATFWTGDEQANEIRSVVEGYIAKSRPTIAFVSTPNVPGIMFERIMDERPDTCLYKRYLMPWTIGYNKVYAEQDIVAAKLSPTFDREYNLKFGYGIGNIFEDIQIEQIIIPLRYQQDNTLRDVLLYNAPRVDTGVNDLYSVVGSPSEPSPLKTATSDGVGGGGDMSAPDAGLRTNNAPPTNNTSNTHLPPPLPTIPSKISLRSVAIGCDPAFGSSNASYVVTAQLGSPFNKVIVLEAKMFERGSFRWFSDMIYDKYHEYGATKIFIDSSQRDVVDDLKIAFREVTQYEQVQQEAHKNYSFDPDSWMQRMVVVPIPFNKYGDRMLQSVVSLVQDRMILIPREFEDLILDLRMAREKNGKLDKTTAGMDLFDSLRLACLMYQYTSV